jgi:replicative DNA helicase
MKTQQPHDIRAEQRVLGGILCDPDNIVSVAGFLKADDFHLEKHRLIYEAMLARVAKQEPMDFITICDDLENAGNLERAGGASYITSLTRLGPTNLVEHYGRIVHKEEQ